MPSVEEQVIADLIATLETIQPPSFETAVKGVHQAQSNAMEIPSRPAIVLIPGAANEDDSRLGLIQVWLPLTLVLTLDAWDAAWPEHVRVFEADVKRAVRLDHTRGGIAVTTRITGSEQWASIPEAPVVGARVDVEVHYRHVYGDPSTPI